MADSCIIIIYVYVYIYTYIYIYAYYINIYYTIICIYIYIYLDNAFVTFFGSPPLCFMGHPMDPFGSEPRSDFKLCVGLA